MFTQTQVYEKLITLFNRADIEPSWYIDKDADDNYNAKGLYRPVLDLAIRPFNTDKNRLDNIMAINDACTRYQSIIDKLIANGNLDIAFNSNPRCFIAIECEDKNSRKHMLGSIINASALGKIGILIGMSDASYRTLIRLREYMRFLSEQKDDVINYPKNSVILSVEEFQHL